MKRYIFRVTLSGIGKDEQSAWEDAVEQFTQDPGYPAEDEIEIEPFDDEE